MMAFSKPDTLLSNDRAIATLHQLSRLCCLFIIGSIVCILLAYVFCLFNRPSLYLLPAASFILLLAIYCGFKIIRQAKIDAHKSAELLLEANQRANEIAALYDTSQDISIQKHLPFILRSIVERATSLLKTDGGAIFLHDKTQDDFQIAAEFGVGMPVGSHLPLHEGLSGRVVQTLEPLIVNDYHNWPQRATALKKLPIGATICVPMMRGGELVGVLGVHELLGTKREFTQSEARLLSLFATNAAGAVENARLLDALKDSEERFRIAAACASDVVYDWKLSDDCVEYFGAIDEKNAFTSGKLNTRQAFFKRVHPEDRDRVQKAIAEHLENQAPFSEDYRILDGNNSYITVLDRGTAIRNPSGNPIRLVGAISNITERKQAEQMKTDFVSFVSHQLRTPLSGVKWMLELAMDASEDPESMRSYIQDARISTERLIGLVNDLLDVSRLERGKLTINYENVNLDELTQNVVKELSPLTLEKEQFVFVNAEENLPKMASDSQLLRQVVLNLMSNAIKYTKAGGKIQIRMRLEQQRIIWEIQDNGIGIPQNAMSKLFEKFFRAGNVLSVETEGTGLGLYLVRLIIERLEGNVTCESEEGKGSIFRFSLPLQPEMVR
jgi:signal transduction histidine kinase